MPSAKKKCICQLCTCGRHMCPHRKKDHAILGDENVSAKASKKVLTNEERKKQRKQWSQQSEAQNVSFLEEQSDATAVRTQKTRSVTAVTVQDKGNSQEVSTVSSTRWSAKNVPKTLPIKRPDNLKSEGIADFQTTHQQDFNKKSVAVQRTVQSMETSSTSAAAVQESSWNQKQIPKTQKIKNPDTLTLSGPMNVETTHKSEFSEEVFKNRLAQASQQDDTFQRPRTSLKLSGEFQSDSSYQSEFTMKQREENMKVKKGTSQSSLKPEGDMSFQTTSLDYNAVSNRASVATDGTGSIKPKLARPESEIKIPAVPILDQTTADTDFKRWNVERSIRRKPADTLQIGDSSESQLSVSKTVDASYSRSQVSNMETTISDYKNWEVSRPVIQKPENNLKPEGDFTFTTTHDVDYSSTKDRSLRQSNLETLTERTERDSVIASDYVENVSTSQKLEVTADTANIVTSQSTEHTDIKSDSSAIAMAKNDLQTTEKSAIDIIKSKDTGTFEGNATIISGEQSKTSEGASVSHEKSNSLKEVVHESSEVLNSSDLNDEQMQYVTWDEIRPKPIRPQSNLHQEGEMEFNTTNRSEFVSRSVERVKGVRPKTTTKMFEGDFDSTTMNQVMFAHEQGERVNPIRPKSNLHLEGGDFVSETTASREFQPWHVERPSKIVPKSNLTQEGDIDFTTTNAVEFEEKRSEKVQAIRPTTTNKVVGGDVDMTTTNREMHSEFPIERVKKIVPQSTLRMNSGEFTSETTNRTQFQEWDIERPKPIKHLPSLKQEGSMDFTTTNKMQFEEKPMEKVTQFRPHTSTKITGDFDGTTTNQVMFATHSTERPQMVKPKGNLELEKGTFSSNTTNKSEFQQWQLSKSEAVTPRNNLQQEGDMEFTTTNSSQYGLKTIEKVSEIRPKTNTIISGEFDSTTTNRTMHSEFPIERVKKIVPQSTLRMNSGEFSSETTNRTQFQEWEVERPKAVKPVPNLKQEGSMDFTTMNKMQFEEKPMEKVTQFRPHTSTKITGDFDGTTTNQIMFAAQSTERPQIVKPKGNLELEKGKFSSSTTNKSEFQQWQLSKSEAVTPRNNLQQEGDMEFTTTNASQYGLKTIDKVSEIRPKTNTIISGEFDSTTTNRTMHSEFPIERTKKIVPQSTLRMNSGEFSSETTNRTQFQEWDIDRPKVVKPVSNLKQEGSMDFTTMNQIQFEEKPMEKVSQFRPQTSTKLTGDFDGTTTNQVMYAVQPTERPHMIKPKGNLELEKGTFASSTTNKSEFQQWQLSKSEAVTPRNNLQQEGDMEFTTTNSSQYGLKTIDKVSEIRPKTNTIMSGEFDGTTTNQAMFQVSPGEKPKAVRPKTNLKLEEGVFIDETTNKKEFQTWEYSKPSPIKPHSSLHQEGSIDFTTTNDLQFTGKTAERTSVIKPPASTKIIGDGDFEGMTTNQAMYQTNVSEKVRGKRPSTNIHLESGKFEGQTTSRKEYQEWEINKPSPIKPVGNLTQEGKMDFTTSNQTDFQRKEISKVEPIKPHATSPISGKFDGTTTNQMMFQMQSVDKVQNVKPKDNLHVESGQFNSETTSTREYNFKVGSKPSPIKPQSNLTQGEFDFTTCNQLQFEGKQGNKTEQIRPKTLTKASDGKFYSTTTNQEMYQAPKMDVVKSKKPSDNLQLENGDFEGKTTTDHEYQQWKVQKQPKSFQLASSLTQEGDMNFETTNHLEFKEKEFERVKQVRPKTTNKIEGDFEATTTNQVMYQSPEKLERVKPIRHENNLQVEGGKFVNETTSKREFRQWVRTDNRDGQGKITQAAGVRSQEDIATKGAISDSKTAHEEGDKVKHESWKLNGEIKETIIMNEKDKLKTAGDIREKQINQKLQEHHQTENHKTQVTSNQTIVTKSRTNLTEDRQTDSKDISTVTIDKGSKITPSKVKAIVPSGNLNLSGDMSFSTTSQTDFGKKSSELIQQNNKIKSSSNQVTTSKTISSANAKRESMGTPVRLKPIIPNGNLNLSGEMNFSTTSQTDFTKKSPERIQQNSNVKTKSESKSISTTSPNKGIMGTPSKQKPIIPSGNLNLSGEMSFSTTSQTDFVKQSPERIQQNNILKAKAASNQMSVTKSTTVMTGEGQSESRSISTTTVEKESKMTPSRVKPVVPSGNLDLSGEMSFSTTSQTDFVKQAQTSRRQLANVNAQKPSENLNLSGEMSFSTTSQTDYSPATRLQQSNAVVQRQTQRIGGTGSPTYESWKLADSKLISRSSETKEQRSPSRFELETSQRKEMQRSPIKVPPKRFKPDDNLKPEPVPFQGESTSKTEFKKWETRRSSSKKRDETLKQEGKMEFDVTSNDYSLMRNYQTNRDATKAKSKADQRGSLGQSGAMEFSTTQTSSYTGSTAAARSKTMRPRSSLKLGMEEASIKDAMSSTRSNPETSSQDLTSTSRASYVGHSTTTRIRAHRPTTSQKIGQGGTFESQTTSKSSFMAPREQIEKARPIKPSSHNILDTSDGFVGETTYRKSFESSKTVCHCPVIDLQTGRSALSFNEEKNGHIFYAPKVQG